MTLGDFSLGISLPNASKSTSATPLDSGAVAYPSAGASSNAVVPTEGGAQIVDAQGNTLTQIVSHKGLTGVAYPVVADPLPLIVLVLTTVAVIVVAAAVLGVATWIVVSWWNTCRSQGRYPQLSTKNGFTARCVR